MRLAPLFKSLPVLALALALAACSNKKEATANLTPAGGGGSDEAPLTAAEAQLQADIALQNEVIEKTTAFNNKYLAEDAQTIARLPIIPVYPAEGMRVVEQAIAKLNAKVDSFVNLSEEELTRQSVIKDMDAAFHDFFTATMAVEFQAYLSNDKRMRALAYAMDEKTSKWFVEYNLRKDVYDQYVAFAKKNPDLSPAEAKALKETIEGFESNGINLPDDQRALYEETMKELAALGSEYQKKKGEAGKVAELVLTREELGDMPEKALEEIEQYKQEDGTYKFNPSIYSQVRVIFESCPVEATRKKTYVARRNFAKDYTTEIIEGILQRRIKAAKLLGKETWADVKLTSKMAKNPTNVLNFLEETSRNIRPKMEKELEELRKLKVEKTGDKDAQINHWDVGYYQIINTKRTLNFDPTEVRPYFEYQRVLDKMLEHYALVFGIEFEYVEDIPYKWDEDLQLVRFTDKASGKHLGFLYLDMFPRPEQEKYGHFAHLTMSGNIKLSDGKNIRPVSVVMCNFEKPTADQPSLLTLDHVETLFHEFGHAVHAALTQAELFSQSGTSVARDFVEAPSQFLEFFVTDETAINDFAKHHETGEPLPDEILKKIKQYKLNGVATRYGFQMALANTDMSIHSMTDENVSYDTIEKTLNEAFSEFYISPNAPLAMMTSFGHIWGGYDASYYGYAWSDVIAADLASAFEASDKGFYDTELGLKYRKEILEPGSSRDENESIERFLGRPFNSEAFKRKLGVN